MTNKRAAQFLASERSTWRFENQSENLQPTFYLVKQLFSSED